MWSKFLLFCVLLLPHHVYSLNVLAIISIPHRSHYMAFKNLFHELAERGHKVTVINSFPEPASPNLRYIDIQAKFPNSNFTTLDMYEAMNPSTLHLKNFLNHVNLGAPHVNRDCEVLLTNAKIKTHLTEGNKYDVIFVEQFLSDCALAYAGVYFDAPIIGITSHVLLPWTWCQLGIPTDLASDYFYFSTGSPKMSFLSKIENVLMYLFTHLYGKPVINKNIYDVFEKYAPDVALDIDRIAKDKMKMVFAYQHFSMTGARLLAPQLLEIAGIHIKKSKTVPKDIEDFLADAQHGAILVCFGSNLRLSSMTPQMLESFLAAFKLIPQKVLLKWEEDDFPAGHENVLWRKWFPQLDVLCHPKVLAFVSHGGMLSMSEAVHCGKPILTIPFFGDQFSNAVLAREGGFGKTLYFASITSENLADTIKELTSPELQKYAQMVSKQWHDRPQAPIDSAIYWTEYVARHNGPPSLPSKHASLIERFLLDVITVILLILFMIISIVYAVYKLLGRLLCKVFGPMFCRKVDKKKKHR